MPSPFYFHQLSLYLQHTFLQHLFDHYQHFYDRLTSFNNVCSKVPECLEDTIMEGAMNIFLKYVRTCKYSNTNIIKSRICLQKRVETKLNIGKNTSVHQRLTYPWNGIVRMNQKTQSRR